VFEQAGMKVISKNIEGKVVVITGASSGLGEATALNLSAQGGIVVLGARRADRIKSLAEDLVAKGSKALAVPTNVTRYDQLRSWSMRLFRHMGASM
jgi:NADP-dependent 3-hydroxy acid dehydrogenase YdfG